MSKAGRRSMSAIARLLCSLGVFIAGLAALGVHAAPRAFVASTGNDLNPCTLGQPCRGFAAAIAAADSGGEVVVLDSAGYGPVTIGKSISIVAPLGVYAGVSVASGDGITIDGPNIDVALRGLAINGQGGSAGIAFTQGASLAVERCNIDNLSDGIRIDGPGVIVVSNSTSLRNANGIVVYSDATVAITESRFQFNSLAGVSLQGPVKATIDHTVVEGNGSVGVYVVTDVAGTADVAIDSSSITGSFAYGVYVAPFSGSTILRVAITRSTIAQNPSGVWATSAAPASGTAVVAVTSSHVVDSSGNGITANGTGTTVRVSGNRVMRSGGFGVAAQGGGVIYSPVTNYMRDNGVDAAGQTADGLL